MLCHGTSSYGTNFTHPRTIILFLYSSISNNCGCMILLERVSQRPRRRHCRRSHRRASRTSLSFSCQFAPTFGRAPDCHVPAGRDAGNGVNDVVAETSASLLLPFLVSSSSSPPPSTPRPSTPPPPQSAFACRLDYDDNSGPGTSGTIPSGVRVGGGLRVRRDRGADRRRRRDTTDTFNCCTSTADW